MRPIDFRGSSLDDLRVFPVTAMKQAGYQLDKVQHGLMPDDSKPMPTIGKGVTEIRIWDEAGTFRVVYVAKFEDAVLLPEEDPANRAQGHRACRQAIQRPAQGVDARTANRCASVWDAIENTPQEAASMKARSALMIELTSVIQDTGMTQAEAADLFGVTQPRISDLVRGKVNLFSLDTLMDMAATAGMSPVVKLSKPKLGRRRATPRRRIAEAA